MGETPVICFLAAQYLFELSFEVWWWWWDEGYGMYVATI